MAFSVAFYVEEWDMDSKERVIENFIVGVKGILAQHGPTPKPSRRR